ncbi:MAG: FecR family protein [Spirochaetales bacterium]|nr:FecR family protein [Spirochaetales bacterium]
MAKEHKSKAGLIVLVIILIIIAIPVSLIILIQPGTSQWNSITAPAPDNSAGLGINHSSIILTEDWLERRIDDAMKLVNEENPDFQMAGSDVTLKNGKATLLAGAVITNPLSSKDKTIKGAVESTLSASLISSQELQIQLESIKVGRLPLPVKLLSKIQALKSSLNTENLLKGKEADFNLETMTAMISLEEMMNDISPGSRMNNLQILDGKISIAITLSPELNSDIQELALILAKTAPGLKDEIISSLKSGDTDNLETATSLIQEMAEQKPRDPSAVLSYMEGDVVSTHQGEAHHPDFGETLEEGSTLSTGADSYAEIILPGRSVLKLLEKTEVVIHSARQTGMTEENRLDLAGGKIRAVVNSLDNEEDIFSVEAGMTTMGVRGTDFVILYDGKVELSVLMGAVAMETEGGLSLVEENQRATVKKAEKPVPESLSSGEKETILKTIPLLTDADTMESLFSYNAAPSVMQLFTSCYEYYLSLSPDEQKQLEQIVTTYMEDNPELMEEMALFAERQGWTEEFDFQ